MSDLMMLYDNYVDVNHSLDDVNAFNCYNMLYLAAVFCCWLLMSWSCMSRFMLSECKKLSMIMSYLSCPRCCLSCWKVESIAYSLKLGALGPAAFVLIKVGGFRPGSLCAHLCWWLVPHAFAYQEVSWWFKLLSCWVDRVALSIWVVLSS
jgi:hypothetical protein